MSKCYKFKMLKYKNVKMSKCQKVKNVMTTWIIKNKLSCHFLIVLPSNYEKETLQSFITYIRYDRQTRNA